MLDDAGKIIGARLKNAVGDLPVGTLIDYEGVGTMSKSKNNGVDPQDIIEKYGADTARLYTMFTAPPEATLEWNDAGVEGSYRFLRRVWNFSSQNFIHSKTYGFSTPSDWKSCASDIQKARTEVFKILKQANYDYERMQYNTVVSACMKLLNTIEGVSLVGNAGALPRANEVLAFRSESISILLRILYPTCPHLTHVLWTELGYATQYGDLLDAPWPEVDASALQQDEIELMLQINGKLRGSVTVPAGAGKAEIEAAALASEAFVKQAAGAPARKVIVVPGRLVNIVV